MRQIVKTVARSGIAALTVALAGGAVASTHDRWETRSDKGRCWALSVPLSSEGTFAGRGAAYVSITNFPAEGIRGSVAIVSGSKESAGGDAYATIGGRRFPLLPFGGAAFAKSGSPEATLIDAMRRGMELEVTWALESGTVVDRYSLSGFSASKTEIDGKCR